MTKLAKSFSINSFIAMCAYDGMIKSNSFSFKLIALFILLSPRNVPTPELSLIPAPEIWN
jgi:hypothetical protein